MYEVTKWQDAYHSMTVALACSLRELRGAQLKNIFGGLPLGHNWRVGHYRRVGHYKRVGHFKIVGQSGKF